MQELMTWRRRAVLAKDVDRYEMQQLAKGKKLAEFVPGKFYRKHTRNLTIVEDYLSGVPVYVIARECMVSQERVYQILRYVAWHLKQAAKPTTLKVVK